MGKGGAKSIINLRSERGNRKISNRRQTEENVKKGHDCREKAAPVKKKALKVGGVPSRKSTYLTRGREGGSGRERKTGTSEQILAPVEGRTGEKGYRRDRKRAHIQVSRLMKVCIGEKYRS